MSLQLSTANYGANRSVLGTIGAGLGAIGGFIGGGVGGAIAGAAAGRGIGDAISGPGKPPASPIPQGPAGPGIGGGINIGGGSGITLGGGINFGPPIDAGQGVVLSGSSSTAPSCYGMRGYHLNKRPLGVTLRHGPKPAHSVWVRNRHMNAGNARAANRAIHRLKAAHRIFKKIDRLIGHHRARSVRVGRKR